MKVEHVLAGIAVAHHDTALDWYARLLGHRFDARPIDGLTEWHYPTTDESTPTRHQRQAPTAEQRWTIGKFDQ